jgi:hypothetical protein
VSGWERAGMVNGAAQSPNTGARAPSAKTRFQDNLIEEVADTTMKPVAPSSHPERLPWSSAHPEPLETLEVMHHGVNQGAESPDGRTLVMDMDELEDPKLAGAQGSRGSSYGDRRSSADRRISSKGRPISAKRKASPKPGRASQSGSSDLMHPYAVREGFVPEAGDASPPPTTPTERRRTYVHAPSISRASPPRGAGRPASSMRGADASWGSMEGPNIASI